MEAAKRKVARVEAARMGFCLTDWMRFVPHERGFVQFFLRSAGGRARLQRTLSIFDQRPEVFRAANAVWKAKADRSHHELKRARDAMREAVQKPAKVIVAKAPKDGMMCSHVNLYPSQGYSVDALFMLTVHIDHVNGEDAHFSVITDQAHWSWSEWNFYAPDDRYRRAALVTLTDPDHPITVKSDGYQNIGKTGKSLLVIGAEAERMSRDELEERFALRHVECIIGEEI